MTLIDRGGASVGAGGAQAPLPPKNSIGESKELEEERRESRKKKREEEE